MSRIPVMLCVTGGDSVALLSILALSNAQFIGLAATRSLKAVLFLVRPVFLRLTVAPDNSLPAVIRYCLSVLHKTFPLRAALLLTEQFTTFHHRIFWMAAQTGFSNGKVEIFR